MVIGTMTPAGLTRIDTFGFVALARPCANVSISPASTCPEITAFSRVEPSGMSMKVRLSTYGSGDFQ